MVLRAEEALRKEVHRKQHTVATSSPGRGSLSSVPSVLPTPPTVLECFHSLAGKRIGREAPAWRSTRPCWGSETSYDAAFSWLPTCLPIPDCTKLGPGQHREGKTWGDWPRPLVPWPQHVIHSQWGAWGLAWRALSPGLLPGCVLS